MNEDEIRSESELGACGRAADGRRTASKSQSQYWEGVLMVSTICFDMESSMLRIRLVGLLSVGLCVKRATEELVTRSRNLRGRVDVQNRGTKTFMVV